MALGIDPTQCYECPVCGETAHEETQLSLGGQQNGNTDGYRICVERERPERPGAHEPIKVHIHYLEASP